MQALDSINEKRLAKPFRRVRLTSSPVDFPPRTSLYTTRIPCSDEMRCGADHVPISWSFSSNSSSCRPL
jgi:hypothetical protein